MAAVDERNQAVDLVAENVFLTPDQLAETPDLMVSGIISSNAEIRSHMVSSSNGSSWASSMVDLSQVVPVGNIG